MEKLRFLYVEDMKLNAAILEAMVNRLFEVEYLWVESAEEGLALLENQSIDLIFMDINLPGMSGLQAIDCIRDQPDHRNMPIIAVTADASSEMQIQLEKRLGRDVIIKPVMIERLQQAVQRHFPDMPIRT